MIKEPIVQVWSEVEVDFKYSSITELMNIEYRHIKYWQLMGLLLKRLSSFRVYENHFFHIRYLKWRGNIKTIPVYLVLMTLCRLTNVKIVWTCHNILEYSMPSRRQNEFLRKLVFYYSYRVIVMHSDLIKYLPERSEKVRVANFGNFRKHFEQASLLPPNKMFKTIYREWKAAIPGSLDIVFISTLPDLDPLFHLLDSDQSITALIITPRIQQLTVSNNVFLYTEKVTSEVHELLVENHSAIGYLGHENISVPTSIYMYASYGLPVIGLNSEPVSSIISENEIGETFTSIQDISRAYYKVRSEYNRYQMNMERFLNSNSWERSAEIHREIFEVS